MEKLIKINLGIHCSSLPFKKIRFKKDHSVGRPDIQKFVGSLDSKNTELEYLFITTSNFSKDAEKYVNEIDMRVVLINGDKMSELHVRFTVWELIIN